MTNEEKEQFRLYSSLTKQVNERYKAVAAESGISDAVFWILYALRYIEENVTQTDIANFLFMNKYTVSSAIKKMEAEGYITLEKIEGNKKNKPISLTEKGVELAKKTADVMIAYELRAFNVLTKREKGLFVRLSNKYSKAFIETCQKSNDKVEVRNEENHNDQP